ncbi:MAG: hypothetical protein HQ567_28370 [Candidatus Nealsonbacteria bacterium]|nr:hypothetical protein [Candidatus Nealsonbacteria bacterium]
MFDNENGTLSKATWSQRCPWLLIFRTFRLAVDFRLLVMGATGIFLTMLGWAILATIFLADSNDLQVQLDIDRNNLAEAQANLDAVKGASAKELGQLKAQLQVAQAAYERTQSDIQMSQWTRPANGCPWQAIEGAVENSPTVPSVPTPAKTGRLAATPWQAVDPFTGVWAQLSRPLWAALDFKLGVSGLACLTLCGLWSLAVWAFFGAAISRIAAVQLACDERVGWMPALRFAGAKWRSFFAAPVVPMVGVAVLALFIFIPGLLMNFNAGVLVVGLCLWPLFLLAGLLMAVLLLGLILGWPLMWGTISTEGTDSFDALSRSYNYVFQRPLHYLFYALLAAVFGALGWVLVQNFAGGVVGLTYQTAGWGAGSNEIAESEEKAESEKGDERSVPRIDSIVNSPDNLGGVGTAGARIIHFWAGCVKLLAVGFIYSYFWTASTAIYLLLRRDVDDTELDDVFLDEDTSEATFGLPPLVTDTAGAPVVADTPPLPEADTTEEDEPQS